MKRSGFARRAPPRREARQWDGDAAPSQQPARLVLVAPAARPVVTIQKENALQHLGYMDAVRGLACARCGYSAARSQFCHADMGKGQGIKTDCRRGWPGCGPHDDLPGCHWEVGTSGRMPKLERREFEGLAGDQTRATVERLGLWPPSLPRWPADDQATPELSTG